MGLVALSQSQPQSFSCRITIPATGVNANPFPRSRRYFFGVGADVEVVTEDIDYFVVQAELADVSAKLTGFGDDKSPYIQV